MKKNRAFFLLVLLAILVSPAAAVSTKGGIKLGLNFSNFPKVAGEIDWQVKTGFIAGGCLSFNLFEFLAIQPELLFSWKGAQNREETSEQIYEQIISLTYIDVPVLVKLTVPLDSKYRPFVYAGPYVGLKLSATSRITIESASDYIDQETKLVSAKTWDRGLVYGGGIQMTLTGGTFVLEARYALSSASVFNVGAEKKNKVVSILVGAQF
jgi:hypothetical protein